MGEKIEVLEKEYYSKSDAFILPLMGLEKNEEFKLKSFLFWKDYSIEDYKFIITFSCENKEKLASYYKRIIFPTLDKKGYLIENYDEGGLNIFVLDISEWALDIEMFLAGRYSKFSREAREMIEKFHSIENKRIIPYNIFAALYPSKPQTSLDGLSPIVYVAENYQFDIRELEKKGELGSIYDKMADALV